MMPQLRLLLLAAVLAAALAPAPAVAQGKFADPHGAPPGMPPGVLKPLPERTDVVSWRLLAQVELVRQKDRFVPQFSGNVAALDRKEVRIQGFMLPLQAGERQSHFVLSATPQTCMFCLPGGPEQMVEVRTRRPVKYTFEPVTVSGRFAVLRDDPQGVFYRLTDGVQVEK